MARDIAERLGPKLEGKVDSPAIEDRAREAYRELAGGAAILDYLPLLIERDVYLRLRNVELSS